MTEDTPSPPKHITFDPSINLGHILTFLSLVVAGFVTYATLNTRVAVLEDARIVQANRDSSQDTLIKERINEVLNAVNKVDARVERALAGSKQ
jgi:uncharacterized membrane protein